ncbi:hypothetical protein HMPREF3230_00666 [Gardnerella vaginalis]|uniref:Uncharacterized protein n=1 Tax=Gardnerella vaginalis TaxID=2702 RepID=A0A135Z6Q1_GARVA|nr:hypothetical protein HMPREF3230_00666 [Gardnerella vaginalis]
MLPRFLNVYVSNLLCVARVWDFSLDRASESRIYLKTLDSHFVIGLQSQF